MKKTVFSILASSPHIIENMFAESTLYGLTSTTFFGYGYAAPFEYFYEGTGFGMSLSGILPTGTMDSITFDFGSELLSITDMNFKLVEVLFFFFFTVIDEFSFIRYLMDQPWDMTLSNNDDISGRGNLSGLDGSIPFNLRENDVIRGMGGNDDLFTGDGHDSLYGGSGRDLLDGGNCNDLVNGGGGNDVLIGDNGNDRMIGGNNEDRLYGGRGQDRMYGNDGLDRLYGGSSADVMIGGNDRLYGGNGFDQLYGNAGNDLLVGGNGSDDFIFRSGHGTNTVRDFDALDNGEDIVLRGVTAITSYNDLAANHMVQSGANVVIDDRAGLTITLLNVDIDDLGARDFIF
ncbi:MAG: calcium-binding protein [Yoonia sp.]|nr:calcium-binding protein [Yoonia sp.]